MDTKDIANRFRHHPPSAPFVADAHDQVRHVCYELANWLNHLLPDSADKTRAIDAIDDACKHANAAIARGQTVDPGILNMLPGMPAANAHAAREQHYAE